MANLECPNCENRFLFRVEPEGMDLELDRCPDCKGLWFDQHELDHVMVTAIDDLVVPPEASTADRQCPVCHKKMFAFYYPQTVVTVDMCKKCKGMWLDAGELKEIRDMRDALKRAGLLKEERKGKLMRFLNSAINAMG